MSDSLIAHLHREVIWLRIYGNDLGLGELVLLIAVIMIGVLMKSTLQELHP